MNTDEHGLRHEDLTKKVIGIFYEVYNELGFGFLESVYEQAMLLALRDAGLSAEGQVLIQVRFRGRVVGEFRSDIVVESVLLLELKAARAMDSSHEAQTLNYLRATDIEVGLLMNFGPKPEFKRFLFDNSRKQGRGQAGHPTTDCVR
jgi:GxxExxY protein